MLEFGNANVSVIIYEIMYLYSIVDIVNSSKKKKK